MSYFRNFSFYIIYNVLLHKINNLTIVLRINRILSLQQKQTMLLNVYVNENITIRKLGEEIYLYSAYH